MKSISDNNTIVAYQQPQELARLISKVFFRANQPIEVNTIKVIVADFQSILQQRYSRLLISELEYIFNKGSLGDYGTNYGISEVAFCRWIDSYFQSNKYQQTLQRLPTKQSIAITQQATKTEQEIIREDFTYLRDKWNTYIQKKEDTIEFGRTFDLLQKYKLHIFSNVEWKSAYIKVQKDTTKKYSITGIIQQRLTTTERIIKKYAMFLLFDSLITRNIDVIGVLNEYQEKIIKNVKKC